MTAASLLLGHPVVLASSSDTTSDGSPAFVVILALAVGIGFYWGFARYYRNANARFRFEDTTTTTVSNVQGQDERTGHRTGLRSSSMDGSNDDDVTARVPLRVTWPRASQLPGPLAAEVGGGRPPADQPPPDEPPSDPPPV
ncbi:hypothetical protein [Luteimicrobium subarcticum]|uniref:Uncharacterized protein n=1 Tax=Luteimicrobium subarcticum TaxID=620910 RepID=A0A2M8W768_9MICO|nr:hypothetical protein [Luteimicrobium subarcticum]PJI86771.1 hypothetical protein CLV34_2694 [Luteimicrobium subarcticum]